MEVCFWCRFVLLNLVVIDFQCFFAVPTLGTSFIKTTNGYLDVTFEGGAFPFSFTPDTCGQLCIDDPCCQSFVAGNSFTGPTQYDCFLAYHNNYTAVLVIDPSKYYDYYAKTCEWLVLTVALRELPLTHH